MTRIQLEGWYGQFGGRYVPETLVAALDELATAWKEADADPSFHAELDGLLSDYVSRPTPLTCATRLTEKIGGATIWLKREDLAHTGAHKINNTLGQALLAKRMDKQRIIAETGAGQHGVATATACAKLGLSCEVYMGSEDTRRQALMCTGCNCLAQPSMSWIRVHEPSKMQPTKQCAIGWVQWRRRTTFLGLSSDRIRFP